MVRDLRRRDMYRYSDSLRAASTWPELAPEVGSPFFLPRGKRFQELVPESRLERGGGEGEHEHAFPNEQFILLIRP